MKMLLSILLIIATIAAFFYMAGTNITFKPFSIKFNSLLWAIGYWMVFIGIILIGIDYQKKGYEKGYKKAFEDATEIIEKETEKLNHIRQSREQINNLISLIKNVKK